MQPPTMALDRLHHDASRNASMHHQVDTKPELQNPRIMCRRCHGDWRLCCLQVRHHIFQTVDANISQHIFTLCANETWRMHYAISAVSYYSIATYQVLYNTVYCYIIHFTSHFVPLRMMAKMMFRHNTENRSPRKLGESQTSAPAQWLMPAHHKFNQCKNRNDL